MDASEPTPEEADKLNPDKIPEPPWSELVSELVKVINTLQSADEKVHSKWLFHTRKQIQEVKTHIKQREHDIERTSELFLKLHEDFARWNSEKVQAVANLKDMELLAQVLEKLSLKTGDDMQPIIQELESLQLSNVTRAYFLGLLKHMANRDKEWAKVVNMWETFESSPSRPNKAMIEIMRNVQEIFMKDDDFLKHLYKEPRMGNASAAAPDSEAVVNMAQTAEDVVAAFEKGPQKRISNAARNQLRLAQSHISAIIDNIDECQTVNNELRKLFQERELYSMNLDESILERLQKVQDLLDKFSKLLEKERERQGKDSQAWQKLINKIDKDLEQQSMEEN
ncbi:hypothetical protein KCU95_g9714, partial [Aureobasidium melanogenum]